MPRESTKLLVEMVTKYVTRDNRDSEFIQNSLGNGNALEDVFSRLFQMDARDIGL